jgi:protein tyrosine/serine phosphatase
MQHIHSLKGAATWREIMGFGRLWDRLRDWEKKTQDKYSHDIDDPDERQKSRFYTRWIDHEILRIHWHNFAEIAPGAYRANHPTHERFDDYAKMGIKTILNLRGANRNSHYKFEAETCAKLGLELIDIPLSARNAPTKERLLEVIDLLPRLNRPFLMHCKSGADRTGLVAALYLMVVEGRGVEQAKKQLSLRFLHLSFTSTGILDYILWRYQERQDQNIISFRDWVETEYEATDMSAGFAKTVLRDRIKH